MEGQQSIVTATAILCHFFHVHSGHPGVLHIPDLPGAHQEPCSADLQDCDSGLCPMSCCPQQILPGAPSSPSQVSAQDTAAPARDEWQRSVTWHSTLDSYSRRQTLGSCQHKHLPGGISSHRTGRKRKSGEGFHVALQGYWYCQECSFLQQDIISLKSLSLCPAGGLPCASLQAALPSQLLGQPWPLHMLLFLCAFSLGHAP